MPIQDIPIKDKAKWTRSGKATCKKGSYALIDEGERE
jgi:hypothetical protein